MRKGLVPLVSPDELQAEQIRRLQQDVRDLRDEHAEDFRQLREAVEKSRDGVRTLILVLVGFAFTVAASAVGLAFSLGGPS